MYIYPDHPQWPMRPHPPDNELWLNLDGAVKSRGQMVLLDAAFPVAGQIGRSVFGLVAYERLHILMQPREFHFLWPNGGATADIEAEGAQVDDVAHGGHAANAQMGQIHLVF